MGVRNTLEQYGLELLTGACAFLLASPFQFGALGSVKYYEGHEARCSFTWCDIPDDVVYSQKFENPIWMWSTVANTALYIFAVSIKAYPDKTKPKPLQFAALGLTALAVTFFVHVMGHLDDYNAKSRATAMWFFLVLGLLLLLVERTVALVF